ncbi:MAG: class I SAM-dependent methyltransferase [Acidobacteria bacterium]|nr:class I SAM-dependent methyltransferase [Acidobacteriota bacterium]
MREQIVSGLNSAIRASGVGKYVPEIIRRWKREVLGPADNVESIAARHWNEQQQTESVYWTQHPLISQYVNCLVTGVSWLHPTQGLKAGWAYHPLKLGLSVGCGTGELERDVVYKQRICERMEAFDISPASLKKARKLARKEGARAIRYRRADFNSIVLPPDRYDIVFFHGSLHHVSDPDRLLAEVEKSLKPHGLVYVDEFVGPSRDEWTDEDMKPVREEFDRLDDRLKLRPAKPPVVFEDPSEMIRSSRIIPALRERFEIVHYKPYWGNLLHPLFCCLNGAELLKPESEPLIRRLIEKEKALVASGEITKPLYAVLLCRKRGSA